ncbi:unnamed protein product [Linum trigynum]|uniref:Uncharacterized protein n=1 Tax=Linum trigynum TaxID=586398 RepID=A0AAV2CJ18_9ROSI
MILSALSSLLTLSRSVGRIICSVMLDMIAASLRNQGEDAIRGKFNCAANDTDYQGEGRVGERSEDLDEGLIVHPGRWRYWPYNLNTIPPPCNTKE